MIFFTIWKWVIPRKNSDFLLARQGSIEWGVIAWDSEQDRATSSDHQLLYSRNLIFLYGHYSWFTAAMEYSWIDLQKVTKYKSKQKDNQFKATYPSTSPLTGFREVIQTGKRPKSFWTDQNISPLSLPPQSVSEWEGSIGQCESEVISGLFRILHPSEGQTVCEKHNLWPRAVRMREVKIVKSSTLNVDRQCKTER